MRAAIFDLSSPGTLSFSHIDVAQQISLAAKNVFVGISHVPNGTSPAGAPLHLTVTGYQGALGDQVRLNVDSATGIYVDELSFRQAVINAQAPRVTLADAFIPGSMHLTTPGQNIVAHNTSPIPVSGPSVQLYQPGGHFNLSVAGRNIVTSSYVVDFQPGSNVSVNTYNSSHTPFALFGGASLTGDSLRDMRNGQILDQLFMSPGFGVPFYFRHLLPNFDSMAAEDDAIETSVPGTPAVNIEGAFEPTGVQVN